MFDYLNYCFTVGTYNVKCRQPVSVCVIICTFDVQIQSESTANVFGISWFFGLLVLMFKKLLIFKTLSNTWFNILHCAWCFFKYIFAFTSVRETFIKTCLFLNFVNFSATELTLRLFWYNCFIHEEFRRSFENMSISQYFISATITFMVLNLGKTSRKAIERPLHTQSTCEKSE